MKVPRLLTNPLILFVLFTLSNLLLAYGSGFSINADLWIFLVGIALPFFFALADSYNPKPFSPKAELFTSSAKGIWLIIAVLVLLLRALQVFVFAQWPIGDDGLFAYYSMELSEHWKWRFFFDQAQHPPLFNWTLALFFKVIPPSLLSIRLFPALLSLAAFGLSYLAIRTTFSRSLSLAFCALCGLSFWPLYAGRFCMYMPYLFLWELATLGALGWFLNAKPSHGRTPAIMLGLLTALGFWLAIIWPLVALVTVLALFHCLETERRFPRQEALWISLPIVLSIVLYAAVSVVGENGQHINNLWAFDPSFQWRNFFSDAFSNITSLFWGCDLQNSYGPVWGGMLNPLLGALFFLGFLDLLRSRNKPLSLWLLISFLLFLTPGLFSKFFDIFRVSPLLPVLLLIVVIGAFRLAWELPIPWRGPVLTFLLLVSTGLDSFHLWKTYNSTLPLAGSNISIQQEEFTKAYKFLSERNEKNGPGLILLELQPGFDDQTLKVATFPFNAAYNPELDPQKASWAAVLCNVNYRPFLAARFPQGQWILLGKDICWNYGGLMLAIIPIDTKVRPEMDRWRRFNDELKDLTSQILNAHDRNTNSGVIERLQRLGTLTEADPFLESCYAERSFFAGRVYAAYPNPLLMIDRAIHKGYPTSVFYTAEGILWSHRGDHLKAKLAFENAMRAPLNLTPAEANLKAMEQLDRPSTAR